MALSKGRMDDVVAALAPESWLVPLGGPRYLQLRQCLYAMIEDGILRENDPLPPERDIAAIADVSRVTVRKAIADAPVWAIFGSLSENEMVIVLEAWFL